MDSEARSNSEEQGRSPLWIALDDWMRRQRVKPAELSRLAGVSRATIYAVRDGRMPSSETLRLLARGLATDPYDTARVDPGVETEALRDFLRAADFPIEGASTPRVPAIEDQLAALTRDERAAVALASIARDWQDLDEGDHAVIQLAIDTARKRAQRIRQQQRAGS